MLFGSRREGDFTFDQQGGYKVTVGKDNGVGLFTTLEPTLHIDFKFFKNSFRLFSVDVPPLFLLRDPESQTDEVLAADVQVVKTSLGDGMLYSDALIWNDNSGWSANIVVIRGKDEYRLTATNGTLNLAGIPLRSGDQLLTYWNEIDTQHCQHTRAGTNICPIIEKRSPLYTAP